MEEEKGFNWIAFYFWVLTIIGALFGGHEIAIMKHNLDKEVYAMKLQNCNEIITRLYE